eukprot:g3015.t1
MYGETVGGSWEELEQAWQVLSEDLPKPESLETRPTAESYRKAITVLPTLNESETIKEIVDRLQKYGIAKVLNVTTASEIKEARAEVNLLAMKTGSTGENGLLHQSSRDDIVAWECNADFKKKKAIQIILNKLEQFAVAISSELPKEWRVLSRSEAVISKYMRNRSSIGYKKHIDSYDGRRRITMLHYLNPIVWNYKNNGGALRVQLLNQYTFTSSGSVRRATIDIEPSGGSIVIFLSKNIVHQVMPIVDGKFDRIAMQMWLTTDTKARLVAATQLESFLGNQQGEVNEHWTEVEGLLKRCVKDNNFRICLKALHCLSHIVECFGENFRPFCGAWLPLIVDRMGDGKQEVRNLALELCMSITRVVGPRLTWRMAVGPALKHTKWRVRETVAHLCRVALIEGAKLSEQLPLGVDNASVIPLLADLLRDSNKTVREAAVEALVTLHDTYEEKSFFRHLEKTGVRLNLRQMVRERINDSTRTRLPSANSGGNGSSPAESQYNNTVPISNDNVSGMESNDIESSSINDTTTNDNNNYNAVAKKRNSRTEASAVKAASTLAREILKLDPLPLRDPDHDGWLARQQALKRIGQVARSAEESWCLSPEFPEAREIFVDALKELLPAFLHNISDLRSQVVKEATSTVSSLAAALGVDMDPLASDLFAALLKLTYVTIQCIREAGSDCLRCIILSTSHGFPRSVSTLLTSAHSRNEKLRCHAMACLALALRQWNASSFTRSISEVCSAIKSGLSGSSGEVRSTARQALLCLEIAFPQEAQRIMMEISSSVARQIERDRKTFHTEKFETTGPRDSEIVAAAATAVNKSNRRKLKGKTKGKARSRKGSSIRKVTERKKAVVENGKNDKGLKSMRVADFNHKHYEKEKVSRSNYYNGPKRERCIQEESSTTAYDTGAQQSIASTNFMGGARRVVQDCSISSSGGGGEASVGKSSYSDFNAGPGRMKGRMTTSSKSSSGALRMKGKVGTLGGPGRRKEKNGSSSSSSSSTGPGRRELASRVEAASKAVKDAKADKIAAATSKKTRYVSHVPGAEQACVEKASQMSLSELISLAKASQWHDRAASCSAMASSIHRLHDDGRLTSDIAAKVTSSLARTLDDGHYRVAQAALRTIPKVISALQEANDTTAQALLPKLFSLAPSTKRETQQLSTFAIQEVYSLLGANALLPGILTTLTGSKPKVLIHCLHMVTNWLNEMDEATTNRNIMTQLMSRLCSCHSSRSVELRRSAAKAFLTLWIQSKDAFLAGTLMLSSRQIKEIVNALDGKVKDIARQIGAAGKSSQQLPRAKTSKKIERERDSEQVSEKKKDSVSLDSNDLYSTDDLLRKQEEFRKEQLQLHQRHCENQKEMEQSLQSNFQHRHEQQWGEILPALLRTVKNNGGLNTLAPRREALHKLIEFAREGSASEWVEWFQSVLEVVLDHSLFASEIVLREMSLHLIKEMALHQAHGFVDLLEVIASKLLRFKLNSSSADMVKNDQEIIHLAQQALEALMQQQQPKQCLETCAGFLTAATVGNTFNESNGKSSSVLTSILEVMPIVFERIQPDLLEKFIPKLMPPLVASCEHCDTRVRRGAIGRVTDMLYILGSERFEHHLHQSWGGKTLRKSQLRLIQLFLDRKIGHAKKRLLNSERS